MMQEHSESQSIPVKVYRSADRLMIAAPMPGLAPEDITVEITADNAIVIDGRLRGVLKGVKDLLIDEWSVGDYHRELPLPDAVDGPSANLTYGNGVLVVAMLICKQSRPARLALSAIEPGRGLRLGNAGRPETGTIVAMDQIDLEASDINDPYSG